jgi:hypothetical protein
LRTILPSLHNTTQAINQEQLMDAEFAGVEQGFDDETLQLVRRMEVQAHSGEWESVESLASRIRGRVVKIAPSERTAAIRTVLESLAKVQTLALVSRHDVSDKLAEIQRGRVAVQAYDHNAGQMPATVLR